ncbi:MAG: CPBP family intramembrane metalloprotease [Coriobacteriia bacterium]|nr:CPBP family intramembrane metalloprotease [Coriobacteriia bacterium]
MARQAETSEQRRERRITAWGLSFTWLLIIGGTQAVVAVIAILALIGSAVARSGQSILSNQSYLSQTLVQRYLGMMGWILIASDIATVLIFLFIVKSRHESFRQTVGLRRFRPLLIVALLMMGGGLSLLLNCGEQIIAALLPTATSSSSMTDLAFGQLFSTIPGILSIVVVAPIAEEIMFRGMVFGTLNKKLAFPVALIMQAVFFGVFHGNIPQGLMTFGLGILLAWVYLRSGSLFSSMLIHFAFNGTTTLIILVTGYAGTGPLLMWVLLMVVAIGLFASGLIWQIFQTRQKRPGLERGLEPAPTSAPPVFASGDEPPSMLVS